VTSKCNTDLESYLKYKYFSTSMDVFQLAVFISHIFDTLGAHLETTSNFLIHSVHKRLKQIMPNFVSLSFIEFISLRTLENNF